MNSAQNYVPSQNIDIQESFVSIDSEKRHSNHDNINLFESLDAIFSKKKENRNNSDRRVICRALRTIKFFADMEKEDFHFDSFLLQTFDLMEYEEFEKDEALFHLGDPGDKFYIVLKGTVDFFVPKTQEEIMNDLTLESDNKRYHLNLNHIKQGGHFDAVNSDSSSGRTPGLKEKIRRIE